MNLNLIHSRETKERWPLLTVETEVMGTQRVQMNGDLHWLVRWGSLCWYKILLSCLGCSSRPSTKYFFPHRPIQYFNSFVPIAQQAGHAVGQGRLSLNVCLCALIDFHFSCVHSLGNLISSLMPHPCAITQELNKT